MKIIKHYAASAVIIFNQKALVLWHKKLNAWLCPGGHIEENESPIDAVLREVKEETNLDIDLVDYNSNNFCFKSPTAWTIRLPYTIIEETIPDVNVIHRHIDFVYIAKIVGESDVKICPEESKDFRWVTLEDIQQGDFETLPNLKALLINVLSKN